MTLANNEPLALSYPPLLFIDITFLSHRVDKNN